MGRRAATCTASRTPGRSAACESASSASAKTRNAAAAIACGSRGRHEQRCDMPCSTMYGIPPASVLTIGTPLASASSNEIGMLSTVDGLNARSASRYSSAMRSLSSAAGEAHRAVDAQLARKGPATRRASVPSPPRRATRRHVLRGACARTPGAQSGCRRCPQDCARPWIRCPFVLDVAGRNRVKVHDVWHDVRVDTEAPEDRLAGIRTAR